MTEAEPFDVSRVEHMFSEFAAYPEFRTALGLLHIEGAGVRVVDWNGECIRHMSAAAARRLATDIETDPDTAAMKPLADGLRDLADKVDEINARVQAQRAGLAEMKVEGHA